MTAGRAVLIELISRYLAATMDPFITLLEIHKLMYFMQEAGENLRLNYEKGTYGPYAKNLRHVLSLVEGHFISGYGDAEDDPERPIELLPGVIESASRFVDSLPDTRARFDRVAKLIHGFETPYGMELLATVHWVCAREGAESREMLSSGPMLGTSARRASTGSKSPSPVTFSPAEAGYSCAACDNRKVPRSHGRRVYDFKQTALLLFRGHGADRRPRPPASWARTNASRWASSALADGGRRICKPIWRYSAECNIAALCDIDQAARETRRGAGGKSHQSQAQDLRRHAGGLRRQERGRRIHAASQPLARARDHLGLPGGQRCICREARLPQCFRGPG